MKTLILGLGNPILSDDRIGIKVAEELMKVIPADSAEVRTTSTGGLSIIDELEGFERVILIDSILTGKGEPGTIYELTPEYFTDTSVSSNIHGVDIFSAVKIGRMYGYNMPDKIEIFAVEVIDNTTFKERCSPKLEAAIPVIVEEIKERVI
jgi:hydrogenase maturation protease